MTKKSRIKLIVIAAIVVVALIIILRLVFGSKGSGVTMEYQTEKVVPATISTTVTATGTIEPVNEVEVGTQVSGIISKVYVDYNSVVKKGQEIAELDRTNLESELASAKVNLAREKDLHKKGYVSDDEYDNALLSYSKALETYNTQKQTVNRAETNLGYATITSPIDGIVLTKSIEEGQTVASSFSTPTLFTIARDLTNMRVIADVDEADIGDVRAGQKVTFTVDAYPDDTFNGTVTQVRQEGTEESNVVTYEVVISAPNPDLKLKPKLTANVSIYTKEINNVLSVPSKALHFTPTKQTINKGEKIVDCQGDKKLWVKEKNVLKAYPVKTGITNGIRTEILSGVKQGTAVITGSKAITPGDDLQSDDSSDSERSPFAPGPRGNKNKKSK